MINRMSGINVETVAMLVLVVLSKDSNKVVAAVAVAVLAVSVDW